MSMIHTGNCAAMRAYISAHPGVRSVEVARGLGLPTQVVWHEVKRMTALGLLAEDTRSGKPTYTFIREPLPIAARSAMGGAAYAAKAVAKAPAKQRAYTPAPPKASVALPAMTSRDYEAAGGRVERLPAMWDEHPPYGRCRLSARQGSAKGRWV